MTSDVAAMRKNAARPAPCLRSSTTLRLFRIRFIDTPDNSLCEPGPMKRFVSPTAVSIVMTSAPRSPSVWVASGPITTVLRSSTRTPSSGPDAAPCWGSVALASVTLTPLGGSPPRSTRLAVVLATYSGPLTLYGPVAGREDDLGP